MRANTRIYVLFLTNKQKPPRFYVLFWPISPIFLWHMVSLVLPEYKKSARTLLLLVQRFEAFALPTTVERAMQRPHAEYEYANIETLSRFNIGRIYISTATSTVCSIPDEDKESCEVSNCQERASSKRFQYVCFASPPCVSPRPGLCGMRSASAKLLINSK